MQDDASIPKPIPIQEELFIIDNPCVSVCQSGSSGTCLGCFRTRNERLNWNSYSNYEKANILRLCSARAKRARS